MNMNAVFLHVLGDFLGSIIVMITAGLLIFMGCERSVALASVSSHKHKSITNITETCIDARSQAGQNYLKDKNCYDTFDLQYKGTYSQSYFGCFTNSDNTEIISENGTDLTCFVKEDVGGICEFSYVEPTWIDYLDPILTLSLVALLVYMNLPLIKRPIMILLEAVPSYINKDQLELDILKVKNICSLHLGWGGEICGKNRVFGPKYDPNVPHLPSHCLHLWRFDEKTVIASAHVQIRNFKLWEDTLDELYEIFSKINIHSVTFQPALFDEDLLKEEIGIRNNNKIDPDTTKQSIISISNASGERSLLTKDKSGFSRDLSDVSELLENSGPSLSKIDYKSDKSGCCNRTNKKVQNPDNMCCSRTQLFSDSIRDLKTRSEMALKNGKKN